MTMGASAGATAASSYAAAVAQAIKASGAIVQVQATDFEMLVRKAEQPLVVHATGGVFTKHHQYLMGYKGLVFFTKSQAPVNFSLKVEIIEARRIWIPG
ncbi:hypothetical protein JW906_06465 [bacterium]|nr:hypothetical protein [bacterium]